MNAIQNKSEQARTITVHMGERAIEIAMGRPGALAAYNATPADKRMGDAPDPDWVDVAEIAKVNGVEPAKLIKAIEADYTYQTWRADGHLAES